MPLATTPAVTADDHPEPRFQPSLKVNQWCRRTGPPISRTARELLQTLGDYADEETGIAFPSIKVLAEEIGITPRQVINLVQELEAARLVTVAKEPAKNGLERNEYLLAGVAAGWAVTVPYRSISRNEIFDLVHRVAELEAVLEQVQEKIAQEGSSSSNSYPVTDKEKTTDYYDQQVKEKISPVAPKRPPDEEPGQIEAALLDRWDQIGADWRGGMPTALRWYTRRGKCRARHCEACENFEDHANPHRAAFWQRSRAADFEAAREQDQENTVSGQAPTPRTVRGRASPRGTLRCGVCGKWKAKQVVTRGVCRTCAVGAAPTPDEPD